MKYAMLGAICLGTTIFMASGAIAQSLGIGAGTQGSQNYAANAGMAKFLSDEAGMDVRVQAYGGSGQSMPMIDAGRLDMQLIPSPDISAAVQGQEPFEGRPLQNLRIVASLSSSAYGFMVREDSDHYKVSDIEGKSITYGYTAQPTLRFQVDGILAAGGLYIEDMETHMVPSVPNGVDDLIAGNVDVAFFSLQGGKTREADAAVGIRWLAVNDTPEAEEAMQEFVPTSYIKTVDPGDGIVGVDEPTPMMGYNYILTAGKHVPDETVYEIVKLLHENPEKVRGILTAFADFEPASMAPTYPGLSYHPGGISYYTEAGLVE